jgi:eukaryotic translation initiation factor 2C
MVPPGQIIRKQMPPDAINAILEFSTMRPRERFENIREGLSVGLGTTKSISLLTLRH